MKIVTYILIVLLVVLLGGGAYFFLYLHLPMATEYQKLQQGQPEFDKARKDLKRFTDREKQEAGWTAAAAESFRKGLANEIAAGKAEVVAAGSRVIVNLAETVLYTPQSVLFARDAKPALDNLAALLKEYKDKEIYVGNMTQAAPAQGKGRKRVPAKDARTLSSGRSVELVKHLERSGVTADVLIAASYPAKMADRGFRIKEQKTIIVVAYPASAGPETAPAPKTAPVATAVKTAPAATTVKPSPAPTVAPAAAPAAAQPKSIPISTVPPKKAQ